MKKILLSLGLVLIIFSSFIYLRFPKELRQLINQTIPLKKITVSLIIWELLPEKGISFDNQIVVDGSTALDLLSLLTDVKTQGKGANAFVIEINNRKTDSSKKEFWAFYVNGKQAEVGAGSYILKEGDKILWKIETY